MNADKSKTLANRFTLRLIDGGSFDATLAEFEQSEQAVSVLARRMSDFPALAYRARKFLGDMRVADWFARAGVDPSDAPESHSSRATQKIYEFVGPTQHIAMPTIQRTIRQAMTAALSGS